MQTKAVLDVSMVVANFNNGLYLEDFFQSILCSTSLPREIIFVDDGSTDDSLMLRECVERRYSKLRRHIYHEDGS
jgi:glycosyltransferase involved in cell wall biosynthesis